MSKKVTYIIIGTICFTFSLIRPLLHKQAPAEEVVVHPKKVPIPVQTIKNAFIEQFNSTLINLKKTPGIKKPSKENHKKALAKTNIKENTSQKIILKKGGSNRIALTKISFEELPGWDTAHVKKSLLAFQRSCTTFIKQKPSHPIGAQLIKIKAGDWHPACKEALAFDSITEDAARTFFEKQFHPIELKQKQTVNGLFTGYYMPQLKGSLKKTSKYNTPIYGLPKKNYSTNYTRAQIDNGALKEKAPVIAWIQSPIQRLFLEIEGSGVILLPDGKSIYLGYAGENGAPYTSIGKVLIDRGIMTKNNASKKAIIRYLEKHPEEAKTILNKNKSFVFFEDLKNPMALGAQGMALTPGYSLAVDKKWIPLGAPLWLNTTRPAVHKNKETQLQRLMIAQDTGGAIKGFMRGDIYWGSGKIAAFLGEHMKNKGHYWLLLPKNIFNRLAKNRVR